MYKSHVARFALALLSCFKGVGDATSARGDAALLATSADSFCPAALAATFFPVFPPAGDDATADGAPAADAAAVGLSCDGDAIVVPCLVGLRQRNVVTG